MEIIHYSRCRMVPTPSTLAASLGLLAPWDEDGQAAPVRVEFGDFDHKDDRLWMRHAGSSKSTWARSEGADTRVVALSAWQSSEPVHVRADSGIRTPADLRGRRVALARVAGRVFDVDRHVYLLPLYNCLSSAGLGLADVVLVDTAFERPKIQDERTVEPRNFFEQAAEVFAGQLLAGAVDAFVGVLPPPLAGDGRLALLYDPRQDSRPAARGELRALTVSGPLLREHRPLVVRAVARLLEAQRWAAAHPGEVASRVARELHLSAQALQAREIDFDSWAQVDCSAQQIACLRARKDALMAMGSITKDFSVEEWVDPTVMAQARSLLAPR
ncbi:MAG TPA: hypothetical protein VLK85_02345 [Ramlibacter sp.]|nr:hypothetical protein [Ramlibacter sp.]